MLSGIIVPLLSLHNIIEYGSVWIAIPVILFLLSCISLFLCLPIDKPAVVITDEKIITRPLYSVKREIGFGQVISATKRDIGEEINIKYKRPDDKEKSVTIHFKQIDNYERLVDILKQRIKVV
jgi:hypothetical protein